MADDKRMVKHTVWVSRTHDVKIRNASKNQSMPMSRILGLAFDAEMERNPKLEYSFELPKDYVEYAFAAEATRILDYMKKNASAGVSLDMLYLLRHDIGIGDSEVLFGAFNELIEKEFVIAVEPPVRRSFTYPDDYKYYKIPVDEKTSKDERDYKKYLKLQKKFEKGETA